MPPPTKKVLKASYPFAIGCLSIALKGYKPFETPYAEGVRSFHRPAPTRPVGTLSDSKQRLKTVPQNPKLDPSVLPRPDPISELGVLGVPQKWLCLWVEGPVRWHWAGSSGMASSSAPSICPILRLPPLPLPMLYSEGISPILLLLFFLHPPCSLLPPGCCLILLAGAGARGTWWGGCLLQRALAEGNGDLATGC